MLSLLEKEYQTIAVNLQAGEHKTPEFLQINPFGQIPVLEDGEQVIWDSQAILVYLARRYGGEDWLPTEAGAMSQVLKWLSVAAKEIQNSFMAARAYFLLNKPLDISLAQQTAHEVLKVMEAHLGDRLWLEVDRPTIADIACFPYIALASEGKIALQAYPNVVAWIERVKQLPNYVNLPGS
jgi:glutathione S-transferase